MLWKIQEICSKMGTRIFKIDEEMSEIIAAKVGNPQNSTSKKWANWSQPWNLAFFQDCIFKKYVHFQSQRVPKWKIAHIWQSKEHKNNKITPRNVSQKVLQSLTDVLQHPVVNFKGPRYGQYVPPVVVSYFFWWMCRKQCSWYRSRWLLVTTGRWGQCSDCFVPASTGSQHTGCSWWSMEVWGKRFFETPCTNKMGQSPSSLIVHELFCFQ